MFWLVESQEQYEQLDFYLGPEIFVHPIKIHPDIHPAVAAPIALYIKDVQQEKGYLINFSHPEALQIDRQVVKQYLTKFSKVFTVDKKALNYYYINNNCFDLNLCSYKELPDTTTAQTVYYQKYAEVAELNYIVPIVKHFEYCENIFQSYKPVIKDYEFNPYMSDLSNVFWMIEKEGLRVSTNFSEVFPIERQFLHKVNSKVYTQYNLNTTTGRPSNTFNSLNFAALKKEDGSRAVFIPKNDFLMEIDLTAYHPTLIGKLLSYESPTGDIYEDFAAAYGMERTEAKGMVFRQLYGNIYDQYKDFELFKGLSAEIKLNWEKFMTTGEIKGYVSNQVFKTKDLGENMNPQKLFNYMIQNLETAYNVGLLKNILHITNNTQSKVVLYTYDAILLDVKKEEKQEIKQILEVFDKNKLKIKVSYGPNYNSLRPL